MEKNKILISKSSDCVVDGYKLSRTLSKYRWVENAFNTCYYDADMDEVYFNFSELATDATLYPNLIDCYCIEYDGKEWEKGVYEIDCYDDSEISDTSTFEIDFCDLIKDISSCIACGSIELILIEDDDSSKINELIHVDASGCGYRKSLGISMGINSFYFYEAV